MWKPKCLRPEGARKGERKKRYDETESHDHMGRDRRWSNTAQVDDLKQKFIELGLKLDRIIDLQFDWVK